MSLQLRNELHVRLGPRGSEAAIWRGGARLHCAGRASVRAGGADVIGHALAALVAQGLPLPSTASICVEDEFLYFATLPAAGSWNAAHDEAIDYFEAMLGSDDLLVQTSLSPCGSTWVAVAIERSRVEGWRTALAAHDIEIRHVRAALLEDLWAVRASVPDGDAIVAMLRSEGATVVGLRQGGIAGISWERCDPADPQSLGRRLTGCRTRFGHSPGAETATAVPMLLVPQDEVQHRQVSSLAAEKGWQLSEAVLGAEA